MKHYVYAALVLACAIFFSSSAMAAGWLQIDGIPGEATESAHRGWIDISKMTDSVRQPDAGATGQTRRRGDAIIDNIMITKGIDLASVKIREAIARGTNYPRAIVHITRPGTNTVFYTVEMENVRLSRVDGHFSHDDMSEVIALRFEEITWTYHQSTATGKGGEVSAGWKVEEGAR